MSRNALKLFVSFFLYVSLSPYGIYVRPMNLPTPQNPANSVLDVMTNDKNLCASGKPFSESSFAKACENSEYPRYDVILKSSNSEQFMCLGFYDRIYRLCHLDTLKKTKKSVLPDDAQQFDGQVKNNFPDNEEAILELCKRWKNDYPPKYNKTEQLVNQLEKAMKKPALCVKYCTGDDGNVVPLCVVLATMDNMSEITANGAQNPEETSAKKVATNAQAISLQTQQSQAAVENESKTVTADSQKLNSQNANLETTVEAAQSHKSAESEKTGGTSVDNVETLPQRSPEASINPIKSQQEISRASPGAQTEKSGADAQVTGEHVADNAQENIMKATEKQNSGKNEQTTIGGEGKKIEAPKGSKAIETIADDPAIAKPVDGAALAPSGDGIAIGQPPDAAGDEIGQNEGISGEDISGEDMKGILDAAKLGSISQHTQEDPETEFAGADSLDPAAVEPPALVDEDSDQTAVQPSEKREYIPHMPSPNEDDSHFFGYFTVIGVMCIAGYVGYHNKQKILAMVLEGRRSRGGRSRRRPSTANYRKLDCTLEEAVTSQCNSNVTHVIY